MKLDFSKVTKTDEDVIDKLVDYDLDIAPLGELVIPWDADLEVENGQIVLVGGAGPSGYGYAEVRFPSRDAYRMINVEVSDEIADDKDLISDLEFMGVALEESVHKQDKSVITEAADQFNDRYFPRVDLSDTARYKYYKRGTNEFAYDTQNALLIYLFKDDEEVKELGIDGAPYRELDSVGLSREHWNDREARKEYIDNYLGDLNDEASWLAQDFIDNELPHYQQESLEIEEDSQQLKPIVIHGYVGTWKITPTSDGKFNVKPGDKNYKSVSDAKAAIRIAEKRYVEAHPDAEVKNRNIWFDHGIMVFDDDYEGYWD